MPLRQILPASPVNPTRALLACDVFTTEIAKLRDETAATIGPVVWLEMGLHDHPDELRAAIQSALATLEEEPATETILLAYGLCGNGLLGVRAGRCQLVLPRAHDCISVFLGSPAAHEAVLKAEPGTYFYSPGWIRGRRVPGPDREAYLRACYAPRYPDDPEVVDDLIEADREIFAQHGCAAYVDLTNDSDAESYCQDCARHLGWKYRRLPGDPTLLRDLLTGPWDAARFLVVPPGHAVAQSPGGALRAAATT